MKEVTYKIVGVLCILLSIFSGIYLLITEGYENNITFYLMMGLLVLFFIYGVYSLFGMDNSKINSTSNKSLGFMIFNIVGLIIIILSMIIFKIPFFLIPLFLVLYITIPISLMFMIISIFKNKN